MYQQLHIDTNKNPIVVPPIYDNSVPGQCPNSVNPHHGCTQYCVDKYIIKQNEDLQADMTQQIIPNKDFSPEINKAEAD